MFQWILKKVRKDNKGFTLIELVVVIAILGILAFIAVPKIAGSTRKAAISAHNANVRSLQGAATMCVAEEGTPTIKIDDWKAREDKDHNYETYLQDWPKVPKELLGKKFPNAEGEKDKVDIKEDEAYKVVIDKDGTITVEPEIIGEEKAEAVTPVTP